MQTCSICRSQASSRFTAWLTRTALMQCLRTAVMAGCRSLAVADEFQQDAVQHAGKGECQAGPAGSQLGYMALCSHTSSGLLSKRRCRVLAASCNRNTEVTTPALRLLKTQKMVPTGGAVLAPGCNAASASWQPHGSAGPSGASKQPLGKGPGIANALPVLGSTDTLAFAGPEAEWAQCTEHGRGLPG